MKILHSFVLLALVLISLVIAESSTTRFSKKANASKVIGYPKTKNDCNRARKSSPQKPSYPVSLPQKSNKDSHFLPFFKILNGGFFKNSDARIEKPISAKKLSNQKHEGKKSEDSKREPENVKMKTSKRTERTENSSSHAKENLRLKLRSHVKKVPNSSNGRKNLDSTKKLVLKYINRLEKILKKMNTSQLKNKI